MASNKALTALAIEKLKPDPNKRMEIPVGGVSGLYLVIQPSGKKSWALRYRFNDKPAKLTLGEVLFQRIGKAPDKLSLGVPMTLAEAFTMAANIRQAIEEGRDPSVEKKTERAKQKLSDDDLVRTLGAAYVERYAKPKNRSWAEVERQFKAEINPKWGDRRARDITKADVKTLLDGIVKRGSPVTANRVLATLRTFFGWLVAQDGDISVSPCDGVKRPVEEKERERVLSDGEIRLFWKAASGMEYPFGPMFRLLLVTGQRRAEVAKMTRKELDLDDKKLWTLPSDRTKNGELHRVPLSPLAVEIIETALPMSGGKAGYLFTMTGGETASTGYSRAKDRLDLAMARIMAEEAKQRGDDPEGVEPLPHWTLHDLRRTCASGMGELGTAPHVIEAALNHKSGLIKGVAKIYNRYTYDKEKREALENWAAFLTGLVSDKPSADVLPMALAETRSRAAERA
ncbi:site-specific integrase [Mesorhizobium sp. DCY119]|uniref:tyrosine-type recombinase/integrase n=1 Tax=Mesorhizobium sp. DCY119 TaxID=2108445 RepID=UPI001FDF9CC5|nr:site-specific integrase [Mesorhizobium sp. DCY119]